MIKWLEERGPLISVISVLIQSVSLVFGMMYISFQVHNLVSTQQSNEQTIAFELIDEYLTNILPEVAKSSYAYIDVGQQYWGWRLYSFETTSTDLANSFDPELAANGHLRVEELVVLAEPVLAKVNLYISHYDLDQELICRALGDAVVAYVHVILSGQLLLDMHTAYTGQAATHSRVFIDGCYQSMGQSFLDYGPFQNFVAAVYEFR